MIYNLLVSGELSFPLKWQTVMVIFKMPQVLYNIDAGARLGRGGHTLAKDMSLNRGATHLD